MRRPPLAPIATAVLVGVALGVAGCAEQPSRATPEPIATRLPVFAVAPTATEEATPVPELADGEVAQLLEELVCWYDDPSLAEECLPVGPEEAELLGEIAERGDRRFIAPLVDMLWLDVGWERWVTEALTAITGEEFADAYGWSSWIGVERPPLPDGYTGWKGRLISLVDERFVELLPPDLLLAVRPDELIWTRVAMDERVPLVDPPTVHNVEERYLAASDVVFGVLVGGEARAYPQRIVAWHELVTDEVGGQSLVIAHCVPCGGIAVYSGVASDGTRYTFGNSGLVYRSRQVYYDAETNSLWDQLSGKAIAGEAMRNGVSLNPTMVVRTTWGEWSARHPNTRVLSLDTGAVRNYDEGAALTEEASSTGPLYPAPVGADASVDPKTLVLAVTVSGVTRAYPLATIEAIGVVHDRIAGQDIALVSRGPGLGVSVYFEEGITIDRIEGPRDALEVVDSEGIHWFLDEERLTNVIDSTTRRAIPTRVAYWFAWADAYPETTLWGS